jgi:hypothetical protein
MKGKARSFMWILLFISVFANAIPSPYGAPDQTITSEVKSLEATGYGISQPKKIEAKKPVRISSEGISDSIGSDVQVDFICQGKVCSSPNIQTGKQCATFGRQPGENPLQLGMAACHDETKKQPVLVVLGDPSNLQALSDICRDYLNGKVTPHGPTGQCSEVPFDFNGLIEIAISLLILGVVLIGVPLAIWSATSNPALKIILIFLWLTLLSFTFLINILNS